MKFAGGKANLVALLLFLLEPIRTKAQRTALDDAIGDLYRPLRLLGLQFSGRSGEDQNNVARLRDIGKVQKSSPRTRSLQQFCDPDGPGRRSDTRPESVHRLRPGDIDIIGAMGDSLTAGNGIFASNLLHIGVENRGVVWSIGGQDNWRKYLTLPNILKEFNPELYGYSTRDGLSSDRSSKFNVAELGAMSRDVPFEAKVLVKRMQRDPKVNMARDWKLITLLIGNNDFCSDVCYYPQPENIIKWHEANMVKTYRYLRDTVPRLMLNVVPAPNLLLLTRLKGIPDHCYYSLRFECPCLVGRNKPNLRRYNTIMKKWVEKDYEIAARDEFNTETFTINVQPFAQFEDLPLRRDGKTDIRFLSEDCFHLSQRGHALCANALWNNMLESSANKSLMHPELFGKIRCPTENQPFLMTRVNSKPDFKV